MDYIVFDLEWNQCPYGKMFENEDLPFEILEIGAVKLNEQREITDTFHRVVKPKVYKKLHFRTREIVELTQEELDAGTPFPQAAKEFFAWCGDEYRLCTWGPVDLPELQRNLLFYGMEECLPGPVRYEDVQKLFAITFENRRIRRALHVAVEALELPENGGFHHALDDAMYTARVLQQLPEELVLKNYSIDCFQNPKTKEEEVYIRYDSYEKYISREFETREEAMEDREVTAVRCFACNKNVRRVVRWFSDGGKNYYAVGRCETHGFVKSKVRMNTASSGCFFVVKTTRLASTEEAETIRGKHDFIRLKRAKRRHHG